LETFKMFELHFLHFQRRLRENGMEEKL